MSSNLKPISFKEDVKRYKAHAEETKVHLVKCRHKEVKYNAEKQELRCQKCPAAWAGARLSELEELLAIDS